MMTAATGQATLLQHIPLQLFTPGATGQQEGLINHNIMHLEVHAYLHLRLPSCSHFYMYCILKNP